MIHRMDPPADPGAEPMPERIVPMLAQLGDAARATRSSWAFEIKWDGVRAIASREPGRLRLESAQRQRHHRALSRAARRSAARSARAPASSTARSSPSTRTAGRASSACSTRMHLASEAAVRRRRRSDAGRLRDLRPAVPRRPLADGPALRGAPRARSRSSGSTARPGRRRRYRVGDGAALLAATARAGARGRRRQAPRLALRAGRAQRRWIKVKNVQPPGARDRRLAAGRGRPRERLGALLVGVPRRRRRAALRGARRHRLHRGRARRAVRKLLEPLRATTRPFDGRRSRRRARASSSRELVAEVEFASGPSAGTLRAPVVQGPARRQDPRGGAWREHVDEPERAESRRGRGGGTGRGRELKLSNLDKVLYPEAGFTKGDVIDYYARDRAGPAAAPARPPADAQALPRRRRAASSSTRSSARRTGPTGCARRRVRAGRKDDRLLRGRRPADARRGWPTSPTSSCTRRCRRSPRTSTRPTMHRLRPRPGRAGRHRRLLPGRAVRCAAAVRRASGCESFAKTSGSKGLQVYVPLNTRRRPTSRPSRSRRRWPSCSSSSTPTVVVSRMTKTLREGKVFVDWSQNDEHKTTVCVYSLRAASGPRSRRR